MIQHLLLITNQESTKHYNFISAAVEQFISLKFSIKLQILAHLTRLFRKRINYASFISHFKCVQFYRKT